MVPIWGAHRVFLEIRGLQVGWLVERVAFYANDLLWFLNDARPSLQGALQTMNTFSQFTGLRVTWHKSQITSTPGTLPLQWADNFTYLGIVASPSGLRFYWTKSSSCVSGGQA